mgnify:CR=1 FL=1
MSSFVSGGGDQDEYSEVLKGFRIITYLLIKYTMENLFELLQ